MWFPTNGNQLVFERLGQPDRKRGFILDGTPDTGRPEEMMRSSRARGAGEVVVSQLVVDYK